MDQFTELACFLEAQADPHLLFDRQYRILAANAAFREYAHADASVIGRTCYEVSHHYAAPCDQSGETCPLARSVISGRQECDVHLHYTPHGEEYVSIELTPIRNRQGEIVCFVERMKPVSETKVFNDEQGVVGRAETFQKMQAMAARVAPSDAVVLLLGESGTGKELVAQAIHQASRRAAAPFIVVDCSGIPETLFESELFGHERGAFTGAVARKQGLVEAAAGGTLFLDEVGEIPLAMQVKLLRLLETGTFRRVGSTELQYANIRVISATHRNLLQMVKAGSFRADLYYRLNIFPIHVPALRERIGDVPLLAKALLARVAPERKLSLSPAALQQLLGYSFPGNVRELRNMLERAALLCDGDRIMPEHLPQPETTAQDSEAEAVDIDDVMLRQWLADFRGSRRELAKVLGMSERTLYRRIRQLG
ncbi:MAG: Fis family transcriptional regulator [Burkholderiaceae bacterium]|nr:Fis family transcriptional regulator [Burkholderiaceae bacterium]